jgi:hypothetical protein
MTKLLSKPFFWWAVTGVWMLALVGQYVVYRAEQPSIHAHASWEFSPKTFADVVNKADTIVEAEVLSSKPGPAIVVPAKGEPSGQDSIPTEHITVRVLSADKGARAGQELTIFRTGGAYVPSSKGLEGPVGQLDPSRGTVREEAQAGGKERANVNGPAPARKEMAPDPAAPARVHEQILELTDDPPYQPGERVFLALRDGPNGTKAPVSPEGRYRVGQDGRLHAVGNSVVSMSVEGTSLDTAHSAAAGRLTIPNKDGAQKRVDVGTAPGMPTTGLPDGSVWVFAGAVAIAIFAVGLVLRQRRRA